MASGLLCTIVVLQFTEFLPWVGDKGTHIGGPWTAAVTYGVAALIAFGAGYGWLTIKSWSSMATIFAAILGIFAPFISYMDGTDPRSSAIAPVVTSVLMLFLVFRKSTNRAMAQALSGQGNGKSSKAAPAKPMSAARKREVAEEQRRATQQGGAMPAASSAAALSSVNAMAGTALAAATTTAAQAISALPESAPVRPIVANVARNAAAALGMSSRTPAPAKPTSTVSTPVTVANVAPPAVPVGGQPKGFRADDV